MKLSNLFKGDPVIWVIYFFLCAISLIEIFSAGAQLSFKGASFWAPLERQALFLGLGTVIIIFFHNIPPRFFKIIPVIMLPISAILLILAMFIGSKNDGGRWLPLPFGLSFQPSEIAKGVVVVDCGNPCLALFTVEPAVRNKLIHGLKLLFPCFYGGIAKHRLLKS